jgi:hypothetical protein
MNAHLDDGQLRAALDGELTAGQAQHLEQCAACQKKQETLSSQMQRTASRLEFLSAGTQQNTPAARLALRNFYDRKYSQKENNMFKRLFASSSFRLAAVAVLALALVVSIPATRALADQLLSLFRVQQVTVIPVDFTGMQQLTGNGTLSKEISALISNSTVVTQKSGEPQDASDAADASQKAGFEVRLPQGSTPTSLSVMNRTAFNFTVDRGKAQALINEAGRSDLVLPEAVDGAVIDVSIPASVSAAYGACPKPSEDGKGPDTTGSMGRNYPDCMILTQIPSPLVKAPAGVDIAQLAQIGFEFGGMSKEQAASFASTVDWTSTLVVPIPKNAATYEQISVDGVTGTLIQRPADDAPQFVLLWVKNGIVYAIGGLGTDSQAAIQMANSLP